MPIYCTQVALFCCGFQQFITRKPSWRKGNANARQRRHSKIAVSHHLGFYRTRNSAIRSADPENPSLELNMEWIECAVCKIFTFKQYCNLETGIRGHSRSSKLALFDRAHTTLYPSSIVTMPLSITVFEIPGIVAYWSKIAPSWGWSRQIYATTLGVEKLEWWDYQMVKEFRWHVQPFCHKARMWRNWRGIYVL